MEMRDKLSAFLDGELTEAETRAVEDALANDPDLMAELDALMAVDVLAKNEFEAIAEEPVPFELAAAIRGMPEPVATPVSAPPLSRWASIAAAIALIAIGGTGGYFLGQSQAPVTTGWLADIANYHAVYASQERHLVEVPAEEAEHIQAWLTNTVGAEVRIPDLADSGLTFEGARLLVAAGKPIAQLMYTDEGGMVVALCLIGTDTPQSDFETRTLKGFDMVSWGGKDANFVVIGTEGRPDLQSIAENAATKV